MLNQKQDYPSSLTEGDSFRAGGAVGVMAMPNRPQSRPVPERRDLFQSRAASGHAATRSRQVEVLRRLQSAYLMAVQTKRDPWDFAIEISQLRSVDTSDLRSLIYSGLIEHRPETTRQGSLKRTFEKNMDIMLSNRSCFMITHQGIRTLVGWMSAGHKGAGSPAMAVERDRQQTPVWDSGRRELRLGDRLVKLFRWPAQNQEAILNAFQQQGWPARIADPLPADSKVCAKRRLHDTIKCLNRRRTEKLIKFRGDGTGRGVKLELLPPSVES